MTVVLKAYCNPTRKKPTKACLKFHCFTDQSEICPMAINSPTVSILFWHLATHRQALGSDLATHVQALEQAGVGWIAFGRG